MIEIQESIVVNASTDEVWSILSDPHEAVKLIPNAELDEILDDGTIKGRIVVKFGPTKIGFAASLTADFDHDKKTGLLKSKGADKQGGARFNGEMNFSVLDEGDGRTKVDCDAAVEIFGRLSMIMERGAKIVVRYIVSELVQRLNTRLAVDPASAA